MAGPKRKSLSNATHSQHNSGIEVSLLRSVQVDTLTEEVQVRLKRSGRHGHAGPAAEWMLGRLVDHRQPGSLRYGEPIPA